MFAVIPVLLALAQLGLALPSIKHVQGLKEIKNLVVFGDSLSDNGSGAWEVSNHTWPTDPAYYGHRFSNGLVWPEDLASSFGWKLHDFAVGGATSDNTLAQGYTGPGSTIPVPSAADQVSKYLTSKPSVPQLKETLFVILIGLNDAFFAPGVDAGLVIDNVKSMIAKLHQAGASQFVVPTLPDASTLPFNNYGTPADAAVFRQFSVTYRTHALALARSPKAKSDYSVTVVDGFGFFDDVFARPAAYGFNANVTHDSCLTGAYGEAPRSLCSKPDEYVFWDEYHPSRRMHQFFAEYMRTQLR